MPKLKAPLLSLDARNSIGKVLTFVRRRGQSIAEKKPDVPDARSPAQLAWRPMFLLARDLWNALSTAEKQVWETAARPHHLTGYMWFMSQALRPNPGIYLPLGGGTMTGNIDMAKHRILKLPLPTDDQEAASKKYHDDNLPPGGYTEGAKVYMSVNQSIPNTTWTALNYDLEVFDTDTIHDNVTNNSRLTCKTAGKYLAYFTFQWFVAAGGQRSHRIYKNGTTALIKLYGGETANDPTRAMVTVADLAVNEYLETHVWQSTGAPLGTDGANMPFQIHFGMQRIG